MYVLIYICHLLHIYLSRNVHSYIDNALNAYFAMLFRRKFIARTDNYIISEYVAITLSFTFNYIMRNNDRHKK